MRSDPVQGCWSIETLRQVARHRRPGYIEACLKAGRVENGLVCLTQLQCARIRRQFVDVQALLVRGAQQPTWPQAIANATREGLTWLRAGLPVSAAGELQHREAICLACRHWNPKAWLGTGGCRRCKCSRAKLFLATTRCPLNKWRRHAG